MGAAGGQLGCYVPAGAADDCCLPAHPACCFLSHSRTLLLPFAAAPRRRRHPWPRPRHAHAPCSPSDHPHCSLPPPHAVYKKEVPLEQAKAINGLRAVFGEVRTLPRGIRLLRRKEGHPPPAYHPSCLLRPPAGSTPFLSCLPACLLILLAITAVCSTLPAGLPRPCARRVGGQVGGRAGGGPRCG